MEELDEIFGDFSRQMKLATTEKEFKGECAVCKGMLTGKDETLKAANKTYHVQHFRCSACDEPIGIAVDFLIHPLQGGQYHKECYERKYYKECDSCLKIISDEFILNASGPDGRQLSFHLDCFSCGSSFAAPSATTPAVSTLQNQKNSGNQNGQDDTKMDDTDVKRGCGKKLTQEGTVEKSEYLSSENRVWCHDCYEKFFVPSCLKCDRKLSQKSDSKEVGNVVKYVGHDGKVYCEDCFESILPVCAVCKQRIKGPRPLSPTKDVSNKDDDNDHIKVGKEGKVDGIEHENGGVYLNANGKEYHPTCFACVTCGKEFDDLKAYLWNNRLYCLHDYQQQVLSTGVSASAEHKKEAGI